MLREWHHRRCASDSDIACRAYGCHRQIAPARSPRGCGEVFVPQNSWIGKLEMAMAMLPSMRPTFRPFRHCSRPRSAFLAATSQPAAAASSPAELAAARRVLTQSIEAAAQREDYSSAAQLKKELELLNSSDPAWVLNQQLQQCVREERFQVRALPCSELAPRCPGCMNSWT